MKKGLTRRKTHPVSTDIPVKKLKSNHNQTRRSILVEIARWFRPSNTKRSANFSFEKVKKNGTAIKIRVSYEER